MLAEVQFHFFGPTYLLVIFFFFELAGTRVPLGSQVAPSLPQPHESTISDYHIHMGGPNFG